MGDNSTTYISLFGDFKEEFVLRAVDVLRDFLSVLIFLMVSYLSGRKLPKTLKNLKRRVALSKHGSTQE